MPSWLYCHPLGIRLAQDALGQGAAAGLRVPGQPACLPCWLCLLACLRAGRRLPPASPPPLLPPTHPPIPAAGKIMRRILRKIATGQLDELGDISSLANPGVVQVRGGGRSGAGVVERAVEGHASWATSPAWSIRCGAGACWGAGWAVECVQEGEPAGRQPGVRVVQAAARLGCGRCWVLGAGCAGRRAGKVMAQQGAEMAGVTLISFFGAFFLAGAGGSEGQVRVHVRSSISSR